MSCPLPRGALALRDETMHHRASSNCTVPHIQARSWPPRSFDGRGRVVVPLVISGEGLLDQVRARFCSWIKYLIGTSTTVALIVDSNIGLHSEWRVADASPAAARDFVLRELRLQLVPEAACESRLPAPLQREGWRVLTTAAGAPECRGTLLLRVWDLPRVPWSRNSKVGNGAQIRSATQWLWECAPTSAAAVARALGWPRGASLRKASGLDTLSWPCV